MQFDEDQIIRGLTAQPDPTVLVEQLGGGGGLGGLLGG
jgi:hypothetical protein